MFIYLPIATLSILMKLGIANAEYIMQVQEQDATANTVEQFDRGTRILRVIMGGTPVPRGRTCDREGPHL
jgi:uncharacterized membrane protein